MSDPREYIRRKLEAAFRLEDAASKVMKALAGPDDSYPLVLPCPELRPATPRERTILARHWREITS